jgi:hypothetical protein
MKTMRILILIMAAAALVFCRPGKNPGTAASGERLKAILEKRDDSAVWEDREKFEKEFEKELTAVLRRGESMADSFPGLPVSCALSTDGALRVITWNTTLGGTWIDLAGIVQWVDGSGRLHVRFLEDRSCDLDSAVFAVRNGWIGAVYSEIHPIPVSGRTCYLALGWTTWGSGTETKVVEVFEPRGGDMLIGKPIFRFQGGIQNRLLFVYGRLETMDLEYDPERRLLTFDNLAEPPAGPDGEGPSGLPRPDGTVRMMQWIDGRFEEIR